MNGLQKIGGVASLIWSTIFLWATIRIIIILPAQGFSTPEAFSDPVKGIPYITESPFSLIEDYLTLLYALLVSLVVLALHERLKDSSANLVRFALISGIAVVTLNLAEGLTGLLGRATIATAIAQTQATAAAVYLTMTAIHDAFLFAGIFALGWWSISIHWAALKTGALPKGLTYLGLLTGIQATVAVIFPPLALPILHVIWTFWLGVALLKEEMFLKKQVLSQPAGRGP